MKQSLFDKKDREDRYLSNSSINKKIKTIKSTYRLPTINSQTNKINNNSNFNLNTNPNFYNTINTNNHNQDKDKLEINFNDLKKINIENLIDEKEKYRNELIKITEIRNETKKYYDFTKKKAKEKELSLRKKIIKICKKLKSSDMNKIKNHIDFLNFDIIDNIFKIEKEKKEILKKSKKEMDSKVNLKQLDVENKYKTKLFNANIIENEILCEKDLKKLKNLKETLNVIEDKKVILLQNLNSIKIEISDKEALKMQLKLNLAEMKKKNILFFQRR